MLTNDIPSGTLDDKALMREKHAAYMREYNRSNGATPVKGVFITCDLCGVGTEKQHRSHDWCAGCVKEGQRLRRNARRARQGTEPVGTPKDCKNCGVRFVKTHKRQLYCGPCSDLSAKSALPQTRAVQLAYQCARNKRRRKEDPRFAISCRVSAGINASLKGGKAGRKWESLVDYTLADLMAHLERQFLPGMSWENRGEWHIDHRRPLCSFQFETPEDPQFREAWALTNLRPLWAADNLRKGGRRDLLL